MRDRWAEFQKFGTPLLLGQQRGDAKQRTAAQAKLRAYGTGQLAPPPMGAEAALQPRGFALRVLNEEQRMNKAMAAVTRVSGVAVGGNTGSGRPGWR